MAGREQLRDPRSAPDATAQPVGPSRLFVRPSVCGLVVTREPMPPAVVPAREYMPPWKPTKSAFVSCRNGWGGWSRAEVMAVPPGNSSGYVASFGVRFHAGHQHGGWHWLEMSARWVDWREEA